MSPPSRGRGSKLECLLDPFGHARVAPFAGAWIETFFQRRSGSKSLKSPPSRGRGSKRFCGRKYRRGCCRPLRGGVDRNCYDARRPMESVMSPPSRGRGSKQRLLDRLAGLGRGRPLRGGVDRNSLSGASHTPGTCRPLRGGVDRNWTIVSVLCPVTGRPLRGGVDRNCARAGSEPVAHESPPSRGRGSKPAIGPQGYCGAYDGRPLRGGVDRNIDDGKNIFAPA